MPSPSTTRWPRCRAAASSGVSSGTYTISMTIASRGRAERSIARAASPLMPRLVVLTSRAAPSSAAARSDHGRTEISVWGAARSLATASARPTVRLTSRTDGAGCPAGAENDRRTGRRFPFRDRFAKALAETEDIGIAAFEAAVGRDDHGVDRADPARHRIDPVDDLQRVPLVRDRQVAAAKPERRQGPQCLLQPFGRHRQRQISTVDAILLEPEIVQRRRAGMRDGTTHDAGKPRSSGNLHRPAISPATRRTAAESPAVRAKVSRERRNSPRLFR